MVVSTAKGEAPADEYGIKFFETCKNKRKHRASFPFLIAKDIKQGLSEIDTKAEV
uniref:Uncharacterized protein n=1 Tax=Helianthus annuus TaxID=4232 RepID=A0A251SIB2_HELAN